MMLANAGVGWQRQAHDLRDAAITKRGEKAYFADWPEMTSRIEGEALALEAQAKLLGTKVAKARQGILYRTNADLSKILNDQEQELLSTAVAQNRVEYETPPDDFAHGPISDATATERGLAAATPSHEGIVSSPAYRGGFDSEGVAHGGK
jgi:hypothetical protein